MHQIFLFKITLPSHLTTNEPCLEVGDVANSMALPNRFCLRTNLCLFEQLTRIIEPLSGKQLNSINLRHRFCAT